MNLRKLRKSLIGLANYVTFHAARAKNIRQFMQLVKPHTSNRPLIRIGGNSDGGYLIPDDLSGVTTCFSPGVANLSDFETAMADRGIGSFMADYSVDGPAQSNQLFHFEKKFLGATKDSVFMTLEDWVNRNAPDESELILQMDIENSEYDVLESTPQHILRKFRIMTIEFHHFGNLRNTKKLKRITSIFQKLLQDFEVVHIHPNNAASVIVYKGIDIPRLMEFTFLRRDRITKLEPTKIFPHPLDMANLTELKDTPLPSCWYQH